ncbi:MAG: DUF2304 domain-containing protein [Clostridia bacterium]|nr:DUF2304 domain-containing protein [Clostridia bacterium]
MIYSLAIIFSILFLVFVLNLVRRNKLDVKYSVIWIILSILTIIISIKPRFVEIIALKLDVVYTPSLMFLCAVVAVVVYIIHLSVVVTKQNKAIIRLVQELSIINNNLEGENKNGGI